MAPSTQPGAITKAPLSKTRVLLSVLAFVLLVGMIVLLCLLGADIITIPYLTPLAHFLTMIIAPLVPFILPIHLGLFIRVCRYKVGVPSPVKPYALREEWKLKKTWVLITLCWVFQHSARVMDDVEKLLYAGGSGLVPKGLGWKDVDVCALERCKGPWIEFAATVLVVLMELRGIRWEGGVFDRYIDALAKQSLAQDKQTGEVEKMEEGESVFAAENGEKGHLLNGDQKLVQFDEKDDVEVVRKA